MTDPSSVVVNSTTKSQTASGAVQQKTKGRQNKLPSRLEKLNSDNETLAKQLNKIIFIHALYGALDGLSISYSMVKYYFDMLYASGSSLSSDAMHDWMLTPSGIAALVTESIVLIGFSMLANAYDCWDRNKENKASAPGGGDDNGKRFLVVAWLHTRSSLKGLKNAYKGVRSGMLVVEELAGQNIRHLMVPIGLALGIISMLNRIWIYGVREERKRLKKINISTTEQIASSKGKTLEDYSRFEIKNQTGLTKAKALVSAAYGGIVDGLYLFMGAMGIAVLSPQVYVLMAVLSTLFTMGCIATRVYEEYKYQSDLNVTAANVKLELAKKKIAILKVNLAADSTLQEQLTQEEQIFNDILKYLESQKIIPHWESMLIGLQNGLVFYSFVASIMYAVATVNVMLMLPFPPALLVSCVLIGLACIIGFVAQALRENYVARLEADNKKLPMLGGNRSGFFNSSSEADDSQSLVEVNTLQGGMVHNKSFDDLNIIENTTNTPSPGIAVQTWSEVGRSFFSGVAKGQKSVDLIFNPLQELGENGHYHDTPVMLFLTGASALLHAVVLALRAYVRGFGRGEEPNKNTKTADVVLTRETSVPVILIEERECSGDFSASSEKIRPRAHSLTAPIYNGLFTPPASTPASRLPSESSSPAGEKISPATGADENTDKVRGL